MGELRSVRTVSQQPGAMEMRHFNPAIYRTRGQKGRASVKRGLAIAIGILAVVLAAGPAWAGAEKGARKCSDGVDNDGDGLIDAADPDCSNDGGSGDGAATGNFRIVIDWDGAITDFTVSDATISCKNAYCDIASADPFTFRIPETYWGQWTLDEAQECFGGSLGYGMDAEVSGVRVQARDHHGSPDHWDANVDYTASFIGTTGLGTHHADFQGDCFGTCPDLPPAVGTTNTYTGGLTRTQRASSTKKLRGEACTCAWEDCIISPNEVTVSVERLP